MIPDHTLQRRKYNPRYRYRVEGAFARLPHGESGGSESRFCYASGALEAEGCGTAARRPRPFGLPIPRSGRGRPPHGRRDRSPGAGSAGRPGIRTGRRRCARILSAGRPTWPGSPGPAPGRAQSSDGRYGHLHADHALHCASRGRSLGCSRFGRYEERPRDSVMARGLRSVRADLVGGVRPRVSERCDRRADPGSPLFGDGRRFGYRPGRGGLVRREGPVRPPRYFGSRDSAGHSSTGGIRSGELSRGNDTLVPGSVGSLRGRLAESHRARSAWRQERERESPFRTLRANGARPIGRARVGPLNRRRRVTSLTGALTRSAVRVRRAPRRAGP
jgi:hypothetical protein